VKLRAKLVTEEYFEFMDSICDFNLCAVLDRVRQDIMRNIDDMDPDVDLVEMVDALADIDYVVEGTRLEFGVKGEPIAAEVHRTNMTKLGGGTDASGKRTKPPGWQPPDIETLLVEQGWVGP
jgi:predicted HAD superfamily Cof-like phosphohydrolase